MSGKPLKLSGAIRVPHSHVKILAMNGDRITAGDYRGVVCGNVAEHNCDGCHFQVELSVDDPKRSSLPPVAGFRRPLACQIIVSPLDVTIVPRPTEMDAIGLLTRSLKVAPVENHGTWSAALTLERAGDLVTYAGLALTPAVAVTNAIHEALDHKAEWFDADPLDVVPPIEEVPVFELPDFRPCVETESQGPVS
jgi:hypothetical protein